MTGLGVCKGANISNSNLLSPEGVKQLAAQRKQKAIKRLKIVTSFNRRDDNGKRA